MASNPMDALSSFAYLTENIPLWLNELNTLSSHTTQKHTEFRSEYTRLINHLRPRKIKSPSMRSIHGSENERPKSRDSASSKRSSLEISPLEAGNRQLFINARRKPKKTDVSIRSGASGPQKFRSRQMVVVHYDGHTQTSLEGMVKNIGAARNNLRKGKQNRELSLGLELPAFKRRPGWDDDSNDLLGLNLKNATRMRFQSLNPKDNGSSPISEDPKRTAVFEEADKELEKGKNLCETAAHQFLRDGDCSAEIQGLKEALTIVLELADEEEKKLREEAESKPKVDENELPESPESAKSTPLQFLAQVNGSGHHDATADVLLSEKSGTIEVDDGDGDASDISVDFAAFRRTLRSGRVR
ncbi:MAG: hypothetical protein Q9160_003067 [Pyrenula sp. 1 TL-2023]